MQITDIETITLAGPPLPTPMHPAWAPGMVTERWGGSIVKISTDEGITGLGTPGYNVTGALERWVKPQLLGTDPFAMEQHARTLRMVRGCWGIEIALWDLIGKACGQPLYKLWGGYTDRVPAYASFVEVRSPEQRAEDVLRVREAGYRAVKLRLHDWTMAEDIAQVAAVRQAVGDELTLLTDANQAQQPGTPHQAPGPIWSEQRAVQTARALEQLGVYWLEEPLDRYNLDGLARLCAAVDLPIVGGENNVGLHEFRWLIERDCYDIIQPEALVSEGIGQLRKVASLAELHHKLVAPHHGEGGIGLAVHLHLCAAIPNASYLELWHDPPGMTSDLFQWYLQEPLRIDADGNVRVPAGPGLGIALDEDKIARYRSA
ncbi:MAG: mandelate racemase/muconate lactonizing enzyme family protein [Chloroflexi bacterium]|nr:mandelate racemase/muconate lactonizing enzyme family protein [Chloroflexota bacterium]